MRTAYRVLAFAIAALVAVQAAAIGYAVFAQLSWIENGGTLDKASIESAPGTSAYIFHALDGGVVLLAIARDAHRLVLRQDSAGRQMGRDRLGVHDRPDRPGHAVAYLASDRRGAWRSRAGPLRSCGHGSDARAEASRCT